MRGNKVVVHRTRTLRLSVKHESMPGKHFSIKCHRIGTQWNTLNTESTRPTVGLGNMEDLENLNASQSLYEQTLLIPPVS